MTDKINIDGKTVMIHGSYDDYRHALARDLVNAGVAEVHTEFNEYDLDQTDLIIQLSCPCNVCGLATIAEKEEIQLVGGIEDIDFDNGGKNEYYPNV